MPVYEDHDAGAVGWARFGALDGAPVVYCHGWPGSRREGRLFDYAAKAAGLDVIVIERPGFGLSAPSRHPHPTMLEWAAVAARVAEGLGMSRYGVAAVSGGGPYALALAKVAADAVVAVSIGCCAARFERARLGQVMNPFDRLLVGAWSLHRGIGPPALKLLESRLKRRSFRAANWPRSLFLGAADRAVLSDPKVADGVGEDLAEALARGPGGALEDLERLMGPWGFEPDWDGDVPISLAHGTEDRIVRPAETLASLGCPASRVTMVQGEGHYSLAIRRADLVLAPVARALAGDA